MNAIALPAEATSVKRGRTFVGELAVKHLVDADSAVLLTSELVSNVIRHAHTTVTVSVKPGPPLRVEVHDGVGATKAFRELIELRPPSAPDTASSGIIHDLAARLGLDDHPDGGKVVWFEL